MDSLEQILRPILQPVTRALPTPIRDLGISLLGQKCYISLADNINLSDTECLKLGISKGLGIGIIGASSVVKIPQLLKLLNSQSAEGLSFLSYFLETASYLITLAYNVRQGFPFSTYGEIALIAVQNIAIAVLILRFTGQGAGAAAFVAGLAAAGYALFTEGVIDNTMLGYAQAGAGMLGVASKLPQIVAVFNQGGTGQLSAFAVSSRTPQSASRVLISPGLQLPRRLFDPHLHDFARGGRQVDSVWVHCWFHPQPDPCSANGLLLEQPYEQGHTITQVERVRKVCREGDYKGREADCEREDRAFGVHERRAPGLLLWKLISDQEPVYQAQRLEWILKSYCYRNLVITSLHAHVNARFNQALLVTPGIISSSLIHSSSQTLFCSFSPCSYLPCAIVSGAVPRTIIPGSATLQS